MHIFGKFMNSFFAAKSSTPLTANLGIHWALEIKIYIYRYIYNVPAKLIVPVTHELLYAFYISGISPGTSFVTFGGRIDADLESIAVHNVIYMYIM